MRPAVAGFVSFTEITDADAHAHRDYNAWHQLDHLPEQYTLDGIVHGERWVCTPACRAARLAAEPPLDAIHYVTLYLLADPLRGTLRQFADLARQLREAGRFFEPRISHLSGAFARAGAAAAPRIGSSAAAVPFRPSRGVYVIVQEGGDAPPADGFVELDGVAGVWTFGPRTTGRSEASPADEDDGPPEWVTVCFLDADPVTVAAAIAARGLVAEHDPSALVRYAGPFETITPWTWDWFEDDPPA